MYRLHPDLLLALGGLCLVAGLPVVALFPHGLALIGGMSLVGFSIICFYTYGRRDGIQRGVAEAITWARKYHGFDFQEAKDKFDEWGIE